MLLGNFKRKGYDRYLKSKAASGDKTAKQQLRVNEAYQRQRGSVGSAETYNYAKRLGLDPDNFDNRNTSQLLRQGNIQSSSRVKKPFVPKDYSPSLDGGWVSNKTGKPLKTSTGRQNTSKTKVGADGFDFLDDLFDVPKDKSKAQKLVEEFDRIASEGATKAKTAAKPLSVDMDGVRQATTKASKAAKLGLNNKTKLAIGAGLLGTAALGSLIAVKSTQRKTKNGKTITVKGYSRNRKRK